MAFVIRNHYMGYLLFYVSFRPFWPDFSSVSSGRGAVSLRKHFFMCMSSSQADADFARRSILSASCTTFAVWMPKKMYRISVRFVRALTLFRS